MTCTNCGKELGEGTLFCDACGTKVQQEAPQAPVAETTYIPQGYASEPYETYQAYEAPAEPAAPARKSNKKLVTLIAGIAAVALIVILAFVLFGGKGTDVAPTLYIKDKEMFIADGGKPWQVTDDLGVTSTGYTILAPNGKTLFYADKLDGSDQTMYFRDITSENSDPQKLDSNISNLIISKDSKTVLYKKDGSLYRHDLTDKSKIASDVYSVQAVTEDLKRVIYTTKNGEDENTTYDLYIDIKGESQKLASEISSFEGADEACSVVYYLSDDTLYTLEVGGEKEKIDSDVSFVHIVYESGEIYYRKSEKTEVKEGDFSFDKTVYELCYYNGKEPISVAADLDFYDYEYATETPVFIYSVGKYNEKTEETDYTSYLVLEGEATELAFESTQTTANDCYITDDGKMVYYLDNFDEEAKNYDLFKMAISKNGAEKAELYASEVATRGDEGDVIFGIYEDGTVIYGKEYKDGNYDLFINNEAVEYDVRGYAYDSDSETLIYKTDYDANDSTYTLNVWKNGKKTKVAEEVDQYFHCGEGKLVYLADCNDKGKGDLYEFRKNKSEKIDEDVTAIVPCYIYSYDD